MTDRKEYIRQWKQNPEYKARQRIWVNTIVQCQCGVIYTRTHKSQHLKTKKHKKLAESYIK